MDSSSLNLQIPRATWKEKWGSHLGIYDRFKVIGNSMLPLLEEGDVIFTRKENVFTAGDVVAAQHPFKKSVILVKQIKSASAGDYFLQGLNKEESTDSRQLGLFRKEAILGKVVSIQKSRPG